MGLAFMPRDQTIVDTEINEGLIKAVVLKLGVWPPGGLPDAE